MPTIPKDTREKFQRASERFNKAFKKLPEDKQAQVEKLIDAAHLDMLKGLGKSTPQQDEGVSPAFHELALASTARQGKPLETILEALLTALLSNEEIREDVEKLLNDLEQDAEKLWADIESQEPAIAPVLEALPPEIGSQGQLWGFDKYQQLDPEWLESAAVWLENYENKVPFPTNPAHICIPDETTIALVGDWGTGNYGDSEPASLQVAAAIRTLAPAYTIHIGDTYYSGTSEEETGKFLEYWVPGSLGSFSLNSNHEMFPGGEGYFNTLLANEMFQQQNGTSYFALENANWIIIGLDSSYYADYSQMYGPGNLDLENQLPFLTAHAQNASQAGKKLMVMTHQNGLSGDGSSIETLWTQVLGALPPNMGQVYWYWGHQHIGCVYTPQPNIISRCSGHGAIPWGFASDLANNPNVPWFENAPSPDVSYQVMNGFTLLTFSGADLTEQFIDQTGNVNWDSQTS